ncbi:hypothetical protein J1N35_028403 [Gossypium stocksii]|uniref:ATP-dependent Clp protease proteolytic subunit n=1 Tax=Gossypium stocksii TaxID=47602 RepID=A0A9D3UW56_9ROSI|nr:hypothetical protein J1N35_028403 [Gossypium stocksii]
MVYFGASVKNPSCCPVVLASLSCWLRLGSCENFEFGEKVKNELGRSRSVDGNSRVVGSGVEAIDDKVQIEEFILEAEELLKLCESLTRVYVQRMGKPLWVVSEDMERDVFMLAIEAQAHGLVDIVAVK